MRACKQPHKPVGISLTLYHTQRHTQSLPDTNKQTHTHIAVHKGTEASMIKLVYLRGEKAGVGSWGAKADRG